MTIHRPKVRGFCDKCAKFNADCSSLDFSKMPVIGQDKDGVKVVKCNQIERIFKMTKQLNINPEMDKLAREHGLGHWSCVSPKSYSMWLRFDGAEFSKCYFSGRFSYQFVLGSYASEIEVMTKKDIFYALHECDKKYPIGEDWQKSKQPTLVQKPFDYNYYRNNISKCVLFTNDGSFVKDICIFSDGFSFKEKTLYVVTHKDNFHTDLNGKLIGSSDDSLIMFVWE